MSNQPWLSRSMSIRSPFNASTSSNSICPSFMSRSANAHSRRFCMSFTVLVYIPESSGISSQPLYSTRARSHIPAFGASSAHSPKSLPVPSVILPGNDNACVSSPTTVQLLKPLRVEYSHTISRGAPSPEYAFRGTSHLSSVMISNVSSLSGASTRM